MDEHTVKIDLEKITNTCFVVMPFHSLFEIEYDRVIRPAVEEVGLECVRGDEIYSEQSIVQDIWRSIRQARVVVAELSGRNPNVMYEIGLAHAIGKPIIFLTRNQNDVPFDLQSLRYLFYDPNNPFWGEDLRSELKSMLQKTLDTPSLQAHLRGINVDAELPEMPERREITRSISATANVFYGIWRGRWNSIKTEREHNIVLVIPKENDQIISSATITYIRQGVPTIVQETLTGNIRDRTLLLTGVSFTYVDRGNSSSYSLDSFELKPSEDGKILEGLVHLKNGKREIVLQRIANEIVVATNPA